MLSDTKLLPKLATGDMVALEAKYHLACLNKLYNRRRSFDREHCCGPTTENCSKTLSESIAFAQLVSYINEIREVDGITPIFILADLKKMYFDRLCQLTAKEEHKPTVHSTRLKEKLLEQFSDMRAETSGRDVVMVFDNNIGSALLKACQQNFDNDTSICHKQQR